MPRFPVYRSEWTASRLALLAALALLPAGASPQTRQAHHYLLESTADLRLHNVAADPATLHGARSVRVTMTETTKRRWQAMTAEERERAAKGTTVTGLFEIILRLLIAFRR